MALRLARRSGESPRRRGASRGAVVRNVRVSHDPVVVTDLRHALVLHRAGVEGRELADGVAVTDDQLRGLALVLLVLRVGTQGSELVDRVVAADGGHAFDHTMRANSRTLADANVRPDGR